MSVVATTLGMMTGSRLAAKTLPEDMPKPWWLPVARFPSRDGRTLELVRILDDWKGVPWSTSESMHVRSVWAKVQAHFSDVYIPGGKQDLLGLKVHRCSASSRDIDGVAFAVRLLGPGEGQGVPCFVHVFIVFLDSADPLSVDPVMLDDSVLLSREAMHRRLAAITRWTLFELIGAESIPDTYRFLVGPPVVVSEAQLERIRTDPIYQHLHNKVLGAATCTVPFRGWSATIAEDLVDALYVIDETAGTRLVPPGTTRAMVRPAQDGFTVSYAPSTYRVDAPELELKVNEQDVANGGWIVVHSPFGERIGSSGDLIDALLQTHVIAMEADLDDWYNAHVVPFEQPAVMAYDIDETFYDLIGLPSPRVSPSRALLETLQAEGLR